MEELRGEEAGMKAEPAKAEGGGGRGGSRGEQPSKAAGTQTETKRKKTDFFVLSTGGREITFYVFIYNEQNFHKEGTRRTRV